MKNQISRIQRILGHPAMKTCLDCNKVYLPMNKITNILCPFCEVDAIADVLNNKDNLDYEEVSFDNEDLNIYEHFSIPEKKKIEYAQKAKKGAIKSRISKKIKR